MLADILDVPLPQKRLNCVLQFGHVPLLQTVVVILQPGVACAEQKV